MEVAAVLVQSIALAVELVGPGVGGRDLHLLVDGLGIDGDVVGTAGGRVDDVAARGDLLVGLHEVVVALADEDLGWGYHGLLDVHS